MKISYVGMVKYHFPDLIFFNANYNKNWSSSEHGYHAFILKWLERKEIIYQALRVEVEHAFPLLEPLSERGEENEKNMNVQFYNNTL